MKWLGVILLTLWLSPPQDFASLQFVKDVPGEFDYLRVDNFGKLYLVKRDEAFMYDPSGKFLSQNSNKLFGNISDMDVSNGLEIATFFEEQIQVVFLDNQLALRGREFPLDEMEFPQISLVCSSHGNGVWLYDKVSMELYRMDKNNRRTANSGNLNQLLGYAPDPVYMREMNNWLYMNDPERGILVFDVFGSYYKTIPIYGAKDFQVKANQVIYFSDPYLVKFDMTELQFDTAMEVAGNPKQVLTTKNQLNVLYDNKLSIYRYVP